MPPISRIQSQAEAKLILEEEQKLRQRAARQAARAEGPKEDVPKVKATILPQGDGKVSMGQHFAAIGDAHYEEGEEPELELPVAVALYDRGYVNFEGAKEASAKAAEARMQAIRLRRLAAEAAREASLEAE